MTGKVEPSASYLILLKNSLEFSSFYRTLEDGSSWSPSLCKMQQLSWVLLSGSRAPAPCNVKDALLFKL